MGKYRPEKIPYLDTFYSVLKRTQKLFYKASLSITPMVANTQYGSLTFSQIFTISGISRTLDPSLELWTSLEVVNCKKKLAKGKFILVPA